MVKRMIHLTAIVTVLTGNKFHSARKEACHLTLWSQKFKGHMQVLCVKMCHGQEITLKEIVAICMVM